MEIRPAPISGFWKAKKSFPEQDWRNNIILVSVQVETILQTVEKDAVSGRSQEYYARFPYVTYSAIVSSLVHGRWLPQKQLPTSTLH